jgi:hypothetical protein
MRRIVGWVSGAVGGIVAYRLLRRRAAVPPAAVPEAPPVPDARAEELRAKLAETRAAEPVVEEPLAEPVVEEPPTERAVEEPAAEAAAEPAADDSADVAEPESLEERRRRVHEEGRATVDEMQSE